MLINTFRSSNSDFQLNCINLSPQIAFTKALEIMQTAETSAVDNTEIRELLKIAGFRQKGRNRILHLSYEETETIAAHLPKNMNFWLAYVNEIQLLLSQMDLYRRMDSSMGRPFVTASLAFAIGKLYCLRHLERNNYERVLTQDLRIFLIDHFRHEWFIELNENKQTSNEFVSDDCVTIQSCIRLLELYRDELISPPRLKPAKTNNEFVLHELQIDECHLKDDDRESQLEETQEFTDEIYYDELPRLDVVLDWFIATKPVLDQNQLKRGWLHIQRLSEKWHKQCARHDNYRLLINKYPSWNCAVADNQDAWLAKISSRSPFKIIPLTTPQQLWEESQLMNHCAITYLGSCISGTTRIFSLCDANNGERVCTVELSLHCGQWKLVQLKGKHNKELMYRSKLMADPLARALDILVTWHNDCEFRFNKDELKICCSFL